MLVGELGQGADLVRRIDGAELGGLRNRDDARLGGVLIADPGDPLRCQVGGELAVGSLNRQQLDAGDPLRGSALVDVQVCGGGADDGFVGARQRLEREDVGAAAVEDHERLRRLPEVLPEAPPGGGRVIVIAVGDHVPFVGRGDRRKDLRVGA